MITLEGNSFQFEYTLPVLVPCWVSKGNQITERTANVVLGFLNLGTFNDTNNEFGIVFGQHDISAMELKELLGSVLTGDSQKNALTSRMAI
jgi:hypothetical protein